MAQVILPPFFHPVVFSTLLVGPNAQGVEIDGDLSPDERIDVADLAIDLLDLGRPVLSGRGEVSVQFDAFWGPNQGENNLSVYTPIKDLKRK